MNNYKNSYDADKAELPKSVFYVCLPEACEYTNPVEIKREAATEFTYVKTGNRKSGNVYSTSTHQGGPGMKAHFSKVPSRMLKYFNSPGTISRFNRLRTACYLLPVSISRNVIYCYLVN